MFHPGHKMPCGDTRITLTVIVHPGYISFEGINFFFRFSTVINLLIAAEKNLQSLISLIVLKLNVILVCEIDTEVIELEIL